MTDKCPECGQEVRIFNWNTPKHKDWCSKCSPDDIVKEKHNTGPAGETRAES